MHDCSANWGSVRKVRYLADIYSSVDYVTKNAQREFSANILRKHILMGREKRLELIHKHYQSVLYTPVGSSGLQTKHLRVTLPDTLTFLRSIGILKIEGGLVHPLPLASRLQLVSNRNKANLILIDAILRSKYSAYWCFINVLNDRGPFRIVRESTRRDKNLRQLLWEHGFRTDVASFYTLRDLFYELEAINWYVDSEGDESIYSVMSLVDCGESRAGWQYSLSIGLSRLLYRRKVSVNRFIDAVISSYLRLTGERFDVEADLLSLRDEVCKELRMSDQHFSELIGTTKFSSRRVRVRLSFGSLYDRKRNYGLKLTTLPEVSPNRLALYVRLQRIGLP